MSIRLPTKGAEIIKSSRKGVSIQKLAGLKFSTQHVLFSNVEEFVQSTALPSFQLKLCSFKIP